MAIISLHHKILTKIRSILETKKKVDNCCLECDYIPDSVSKTIAEALISANPCMIARFGSTELGCVINYLGVKQENHSVIDYLKGKINAWWWNPGAIANLSDASGFFPKNRVDLVEKYCDLFLQDIKYLDILGCWHPNEKYLKDLLLSTKKVFLPYIEPFWSEMPWTKLLEGKKVLVVHPFAELIEYQYHRNREKLFRKSDILPLFDLDTIPAVQSLGGEGGGFSTWFEALQWMKDEIDKRIYDICIIGCGAYGFHLAAHVKRMGKKAIHLGGATQLLFGIKGNRWEDPKYGVKEWGLPYSFYPSLFNDYWVKPGDKYKPKNAQQVEGACYW